MPQGVCLSPLFFCLYISPVVDLIDTFTKEEAEKQKDIPKNKKRSCWAFFFADDCKLSSSFKEEEQMNTLQNCLDLTLGWMEEQGMIVNGNKSYTVHCGPLKQDKTYTAGKEPIKFTTSMRDLGLQFANNGSYKDQIAVAKKKDSRKGNWVFRVFQNHSQDFFK